MAYNIAVIGIACRIGKNDSIEEIREIFKNGICPVSDLPDSRKELIGANKEKKFKKFTYMEDIDKFDFEYFKMPKQEAVTIDPQQRVLLEMTEHLFKNAGYSSGKVRNTNTAVVIGAGESGYGTSGSTLSYSSFLGSLKAYCAGQISYYYGLSGPSYIVDSTCSSSAVAVKEICNMITNGEVDMGIAGGINIVCSPLEDEIEDVLGITSSDSLTRSFDNKASGTGGAEAAGLVLLKKLDRAIEDNDHIYAVIKSCEMNNDGCRGANITAPSPDGQYDVIKKTIENSGVDPERIKFVEAHGTATKIGDPIEVNSLTKAFHDFTDKKQFCAITASKSNIGHSGVAAGIVGIIKSILQLSNSEIYPICHFEQPNQLIDFENSPVYPCIDTLDILDEDICGIVNSFGFTGTNVCMMLQNYNMAYENNNNIEKYPFILSAETETRLLNQINMFFNKSDYYKKVDFKSFSYTMCNVDENKKYRIGFVASNIEEFKTKLNESKTNTNSVDIEKKIVLLVSGDSFENKEELSDIYLKSEKIFKSHVAIKSALGNAGGNALIKLLKENLNKENAFEKALSVEDKRKIDYEKAYKAISKLSKEDNNIFVEIGREGILSEIVKKCNCNVISCFNKDIPEILVELYLNGINIFSDEWLGKYKKVPICGYNFEKNSCWIREKNKFEKIKVESKIDYDCSLEKVKYNIRQIWEEILSDSNFSDDDDFYNVGGTSLMILQIVNKVKNIYGISFDFDEFDDNATINDLTKLIKEKILSNNSQKSVLSVKRDDKNGLYPISYEQKSMLSVIDIENNSDAYKMSSVLKIEGSMNPEYAKKAMEETAYTYEILHTLYIKKDGVYYQYPDISKNIDFIIVNEGKLNSEEKIIEFLNDKSRETFNLENELPLRCILVSLNSNTHYFLFQLHHIAGDSLSVDIIINSFFDYYKQLVGFGEIIKKQEEKLSYIDYSIWQNKFLEETEGKKKIDFWKEYLSGKLNYAEIPCDKTRGNIRGDAENYTVTLNSENTKSILEYIKKSNFSLYIYSFAVYNIMIHKYTGESDFCTGITASNRVFENSDDAVGFFANTLVFREKISNEKVFKKYAESVKSNMSHIITNQEIPFGLVVSEFANERKFNDNPFFRIMFTPGLDNRKNEEEMVKVSVLPSENGKAKFDLIFLIGYNENGNISFTIQYDTLLYDKMTIECLAHNYEYLLSTFCCKEEVEINEVNADFSIECNEELDYDF